MGRQSAVSSDFYALLYLVYSVNNEVEDTAIAAVTTVIRHFI